MEKIALILIDIQTGFNDLSYWGSDRNNKNAESNCSLLLNRFRKLHHPVIHVRHSSSNPNSPLHISNDGFDFKPEVFPIEGEFVITKNVNSAFIGTDLKKLLKELKVKTVIIVGFTTDHCISTSARMAGNFGFKTIVVSDATATFGKTGINGEVFSADLIHQTHLASLKDEFADIYTTNECLSRLF